MFEFLFESCDYIENTIKREMNKYIFQFWNVPVDKSYMVPSPLMLPLLMVSDVNRFLEVRTFTNFWFLQSDKQRCLTLRNVNLVSVISLVILSPLYPNGLWVLLKKIFVSSDAGTNVVEVYNKRKIKKISIHCLRLVFEIAMTQ